MQPPTSLIILRDVHHTEGKSVANYSKKLNSAQINYVTIDEEFFVLLQLNMNSVQWSLVLNYMFTQTRKYWSYIMWKAHTM
jgi:hypothetical protein